MAELKDFIVRTRLDNTDENQKTGNSAFDIQDFVFFETKDEVENIKDEERYIYASDYAVMNGAFLGGQRRSPKDRQSTWYWLRSAYSKNHVYYVRSDGSLDTKDADRESAGLCPALHLNLSSVISARSASSDFKIESFKDKSGKILYYTIEFGSYPQDKAKNSGELERLFNAHKLTPTGKTYTGYMKEDGSFQQNQEFEYGGKKYVRVISKKYDNDSEYKDKTKAPEDGTPMWAEVQPIKWKIKNWDELPRSINPNGNGTAKTIYVKSEEGIMSGIPFYPEYGETEYTMWQNSPLRAIFNGYDLQEELNKGNGNKRYKAGRNYNFKGKGFLQEAFDSPLIRSSAITQEDEKELTFESQVRRSRLEKLNPDKTPQNQRRRMTDTEMIKSWIDAGQSVLLRGPSGIGKTERIKKLYPDLIYIKLTNNMFPEKVVGSMNLQTGQSIPPDFAKQALMVCATDDERKLIQENIQNLYDLADTIYERSKTAKGKVVIMLDELLNVKPAVQSLVYTLVLNKLVETGKGLKLPANTVVVATGNQKKYSNVAEDLTEPLEKRFDHILDMEPKVGEWIYEFAIPSKIHPSVIGYIFSKYQENRRSEEIEDMGYFYEEPEVGESHLDRNGCRGRTNDPRGWESISRTLYAFEEDLKNGKFVGKDVETLLRASIGSKLREEWAEEFFDFYNHPTLTVEEIVEKRYTQADLPTDINEKFATMAGLLNATPEQVGVCREFIRKHCDPEYLSVYDIYWAGNDEKRMEKIAELREISAMQLEDEGGLIR
ncbi:MAG TPA: AAA family ATPase [Candidatus Caccovivens faecavium]|nr:AAA family ATPase [Candidatus Caccovivens faecavium]